MPFQSSKPKRSRRREAETVRAPAPPRSGPSVGGHRPAWTAATPRDAPKDDPLATALGGHRPAPAADDLSWADAEEERSDAESRPATKGSGDAPHTKWAPTMESPIGAAAGWQPAQRPAAAAMAADAGEWAKKDLGVDYRGEERGEGAHAAMMQRDTDPSVQAGPVEANRYAQEELGWTPEEAESFPLGSTHYLSDEERAELRVTLGRKLTIGPRRRVVDSSGTRSNYAEGRANYAMSRKGEVYIAPARLYLLFHSSILAGQDVTAAGELEIKDGQVTLINNRSGHYKPTPDMFHRFLRLLKSSGHDLSATRAVVYTTDGGTVPFARAEDFLRRGLPTKPVASGATGDDAQYGAQLAARAKPSDAGYVNR